VEIGKRGGNATQFGELAEKALVVEEGLGYNDDVVIG
jgi:hypothetical protein